MHCGGIELAEGCRTNCGRFCTTDVAAWTEDERVGGTFPLRGGIAGGGPLVVLVVEDWDWTLGGSCGSLSFTWSVDLEVILEVLCRIADVAFDIDCAIVFCPAFNGGWTVEEVFVMGFCSFVTIRDVAWIWADFAGTLLEAWTGSWVLISKTKTQ